jgi:hypothetical protein
MPPTLLLSNAYPGGEEAAAVFDEERTAFLESGCALILGTVLPDGEPHAGRGWGLTVLPEDGHVRLLLDAEDLALVDQAARRGAIAITGASVRTLLAVQLKGRALSVEAASGDDTARAERYCDAFFGDIVDTDGLDRSVVERMTPLDYVACTVAVERLFDQTPGPGAGARLPGGAA